MKQFLCFLSAALSVLGLSGCTPAAPEKPPVAISELAGTLLPLTKERFGGETFLVYDLSQPVLSSPASYTGIDEMAWTVVAGCALSDGKTGGAVGIIPTTKITASLLREAKGGKFQKLLVECR